jgi:ribosome-associated translation inhibitor RaiA
MRVLIHPRAIAINADMRERVLQSVEAVLEPVRAHLHSIDVYLTDVNGPKGGADKRCRLVAHLRASRPIVVSRMARNPEAAVSAAAARARHAVRSLRQRRRDRRRRTAIA